MKGKRASFYEILGLARFHFVADGTGYDVDELRGNKDKTSTTGIWTNIAGLENRGTQDLVVEFIKNYIRKQQLYILLNLGSI